MTIAQNDKVTLRKTLRVWPGVVIVILQWLVRFGVPVVEPEALYFGVLGGVFGGLAIVVWWVFFSRAPWFERLGAVVLMIVALFATSRIIHESIAKGAMGMLFFILAVPVPSFNSAAAFAFLRVPTYRGQSPELAIGRESDSVHPIYR